MVTPIANSGPAKIDAPRVTSLPPAPVEDLWQTKAHAENTPAARLAKLGPPIDMNRVGEIRAAIAQGRYTVNADRLAAAMLSLDLPVRSA